MFKYDIITLLYFFEFSFVCLELCPSGKRSMYIVHGILFPGGLFSFVHKYEREGKLLKMSEKQSVFLPEGYFEVKAIPQAEIADIYTSKELIADNRLDSFYHFSQEDSFL
ncbi:hypothetical protein P4K82_07930 [Bacillus cereus]|nr:hypothetical protein [Bacillus cereus]